MLEQVRGLRVDLERLLVEKIELEAVCHGINCILNDYQPTSTCKPMLTGSTHPLRQIRTLGPATASVTRGGMTQAGPRE